MRKVLLLVPLICVLVGSLVMVGCTEEATPTPAPSTSTPTASTPTPTAGPANWWDKFGEPQYGGTITLRVTDTTDLQFDPYGHPWTGGYGLLHFDSLFSQDWTVDRNEWPYTTQWTPEEYRTGLVAESWEQPDMRTVIVKIREGINFQNKAPVNGRELTADDVAFNYNRSCGLGEFTEPSAYHTTFTNLVESVTVIDKYTVEFKFKNAGIVNADQLMDDGGAHALAASEVFQQYGDLSAWENAIGTGPWILSEYVGGTSLSYTRNPNYWGTDERYPDNQLPYADEVKMVVIPDFTTALAALRTGQIDILEGVGWQQADQFAKSNPELLQSQIPKAGQSYSVNMNMEPFSDINVRKAMQLAIDRGLIAQTHYGGLVSSDPVGQINPMLTGYADPYDQWPAELQAEYTYDPERARQILADAGYPEGFATSIIAPGIADLELLEISKSMFMDIGIDMEIKLLDVGQLIMLLMSHDYEMGISEQELGGSGAPWNSLKQKTPFFINPNTVDDPVFNEMILDIDATTDPAAVGPKVNAANYYLLEHHWHIGVIPTLNYTLWQPYLKGYSGELLVYDACFARWWIAE